MGASGDDGWRIADAVAWTTSDDDIVALDLRSPSARPLTFGRSAAYVWEELALRGPITADALVQKIAEAYGVGEEVVRDDLVDLLGTLRDNNLITRDPADDATNTGS